jgi:hypothetical protein
LLLLLSWYVPGEVEVIYTSNVLIPAEPTICTKPELKEPETVIGVQRLPFIVADNVEVVFVVEGVALFLVEKINKTIPKTEKNDRGKMFLLMFLFLKVKLIP